MACIKKEISEKALKDFIGEEVNINRKDDSAPAVYQLKNVKTGMVYVRSTENLYKRTREHKNHLKRGSHKNRNLQDKFDEDPKFLLTFTKTETKEHATDIEQKVLDEMLPTGTLLNLSPDARVPCKGMTKTEEQKQKTREATIRQFSTVEPRIAHREISKALYDDPEYIRRKNEAIAKVDKEAARKKLSAAIKEKWKDPSYAFRLSTRRVSLVPSF